MKSHVKLFESFGRSDFLTTEFSRKNRNTYLVDLEDFPTEIDQKNDQISPEEAAELKALGLVDQVQIEDNYVDSVFIEYDIIPYKDSAGIGAIDFVMKSVRIVGSYEVWNTEKDDSDSIDYEIEDAGPFDGRVEFEFKSMPFYPEALTINMGKSFDPANFKYSVEIGQ